VASLSHARVAAACSRSPLASAAAARRAISEARAGSRRRLEPIQLRADRRRPFVERLHLLAIEQELAAADG